MYQSCHLNTSHVLIYQSVEGTIIQTFFNLNTSHVLIYQEKRLKDFQRIAFKYISCSYLSDAAKVAEDKQSDLNTSHVLIYRKQKPLD